MGFPQHVADEVLVKCRRHCCLCGKYAGFKIELHHIKQAADGGEDTADNCIPLCFDCHAEVGSYNTRHPKGKKFTEKELRGHRDKSYAAFSSIPNQSKSLECSANPKDPIFQPKDSTTIPTWGYLALDKRLPLLPGKTILVAGPTGARKSTYVHHIINANLRREQRAVYCCLKESPIAVSCDIIAEEAQVNAYNIRCNRLTEQELQQVARGQVMLECQNLALLPPDKFTQSEDVIAIIESSGAEIVIVDDLNGLLLEEVEVERFMYRLKSVAVKNGVIVFVIYNLSIPRKRSDKRPMLEDLPSDSYYRLFDYVQFLFKPSMNYNDDLCDKDIVELIIAKGLPGDPEVIKMLSPSYITGLFECASENEQ